MFPYFVVFGKVITTYFLLSLVGAFVAGVFACGVARKRGLDDNNVIIILLFAAVGAILGGHMLYGITNISLIPEIFNSHNLEEVIKNLQAVFGGAVFYGGLLCGIVAAYITMRVMKLELKLYADVLTLAIPLFHSFARVGCFLGGCCYGIESKFGIAVSGNTLVPSINDVSRFPVQLLEAVLNGILFVVLYMIYKRPIFADKIQGKLILIYLVSYSFIRFFDEFLRGDEIRGFVLGISTSQIISILIFVTSVIVLMVLQTDNGRKHD